MSEPAKKASTYRVGNFFSRWSRVASARKNAHAKPVKKNNINQLDNQELNVDQFVKAEEADTQPVIHMKQETVIVSAEKQEKKPENSHYQAGVKLREELIERFAVLSDPTGLINKKLNELRKLEKEEDIKRWKEEMKEMEEKYGGYPWGIQILLNSLDEAGQKPVQTRRELLFGTKKNPQGGPKELAKKIGSEIAWNILVPWPIRRLLRAIGF